MIDDKKKIWIITGLYGGIILGLMIFTHWIFLSIALPFYIFSLIMAILHKKNASIVSGLIGQIILIYYKLFSDFLVGLGETIYYFLWFTNSIILMFLFKYGGEVPKEAKTWDKRKRNIFSIAYFIIILLFLIAQILPMIGIEYESPYGNHYSYWGSYIVYILGGLELGLPLVIASFIFLLVSKPYSAVWCGIIGTTIITLDLFIAILTPIIFMPDSLFYYLGMLTSIFSTLGFITINFYLYDYRKFNSKKIKVEAKTKVILENTEEYIRKLPAIYDQITFNQIRQKTGIKLKDVRDMVEKMIFSKQIAAKISGNNVIFLKTELYDESTGELVSPSVAPPSSSISQASTPPSIGSFVAIKEKLWIVALIGVIFNVISLLTPAASIIVIGATYYWMWGLVVAPTLSEIFFNLPGIYGITSSIFIVLLSIYIIYSANRVRLGNSMIEDYTNKWIIIAIITIILNILWIILIETHQYFSWSIAVPGFAIIGIFIGSGLILVSGIAGK